MDKEKRNMRLSRTLIVLCLTALLLGQYPVMSAEPRETGTVDVLVVPGTISMTPSHPDVGELVKITAYVVNNGPNPTVADVNFWDGPPTAQHFIDTMQMVLPPNEPRPASVQWNTTPLRSGFHSIWVTVNPTDFPDSDQSNNNASREMTLTTTTSKVVDTDFQTWSGPLVLSDLLGVWNIGWLVLDGADVFFAQEYDYQYGIVVDEKGKLVLHNSTIMSNYAVRILVEGDGQLTVEPGCTVSGKITTRDRAQVTISNSTASGGTDMVGGNLTVSNSILAGVFHIQRTNVTLNSDNFITNDTVLMQSDRKSVV